MPLFFCVTNNCFKFIICPTVIVSKTNVIYIQNEIRTVECSVITSWVVSNRKSIEIFSVCTCDVIINEFTQITDWVIYGAYTNPKSSPCNYFFIDFLPSIQYFPVQCSSVDICRLSNSFPFLSISFGMLTSRLKLT